MRTFNLGIAGVVAGAVFLGSVGSVSAIEPFDLNSLSLQYQREVRSTYIIQFQDNVAPSEVQGRANAIAARFQGRIRHTYTRALNGFAIRMNSTAMARLLDADDLGIARISRGVIMTVAQSSDNALEPTKGKPGGSTGGGGGGKSTCDQKLGWNIARVTSMTQDNKSCAIDAGGNGIVDYTAAAVPKVCVLDTGVSMHPDLNVGFQFEVSTNSNTVNDVFGHGTHVAGIIGAIANTEGIVGVAPGVEINSIKVLDDDGFGSDFDVIAGIDMALELDCDIVNMSLGGSVSMALDAAVINSSAGISANSGCGYTENGIEVCLDNSTTESNIIFTLSAGNSVANISDFSPARTSSGPNDNIFTIASFGQERKIGNDLWSAFSNFGDNADNQIGEVDFALPGGKVLSTVPGGYKAYNGTSMSAPHMAGLLVRYIVEEGITFTTNTRTGIGNGDFDNGNGGSVQRISGFGPIINGEEFYDVLADK